MGRLENRITLINHLIYGRDNVQKLLPYLLSVNRTIEQIDNDVEIQRACEHSELKKSRINQLKGLKRAELHKKFEDILLDPQGTNFLLFKN